MLLQFSSSSTSHLYTCQMTGEQFSTPDEAFMLFACSQITPQFPFAAEQLCKLDGISSLPFQDQLLSDHNNDYEGGFLLRSTHAFFNPAEKSENIWMVASRITTGKAGQLQVHSRVVNGKTWLRTAPQLIENLPAIPFSCSGIEGEQIDDPIQVEPFEIAHQPLVHGHLNQMPLGVGRILGAIASGFPAQFGIESFPSSRQFLECMKYALELLPAPLRHTVSFGFGFKRPQPVVMIQYYADRSFNETCYSPPIATIPEGCHETMSLKEVRGILAKRLRDAYVPDMAQITEDEFGEELGEFITDNDYNFYDELPGLARETCAAFGQILNQIGLFNAPRKSFISSFIGGSDEVFLAYDALLTGQDPLKYRSGLYTLMSRFDGSAAKANEQLDLISQNFKKEAYLVAVGLAACIRDNDLYCDSPHFLSLLESLLTIAQRLPAEEPFLEYRTRMIESVADGLRGFVGKTTFLLPDQILLLSEYDQVANMIACVLETGDWSFTQRFNIGFTIYALSGAYNIEDASAIARRIVPPTVVPEQWIHALINSRTLAESFDALLEKPDCMPKRQVLYIVQQMVHHLAASNRKDLILAQVSKLALSMPTKEKVDFASSDGVPFDELGLLRLEILRILSDASERIYTQEAHAALILNHTN